MGGGCADRRTVEKNLIGIDKTNAILGLDRLVHPVFLTCFGGF